MTNLLTDPVFTTSPDRWLTLPGFLAALARDEVEDIPALRPHQQPAWHMFTVQVAAMALHRARLSDTPLDEGRWRDLLRGLTPDFADDQPWRLVVDDHSKPAFLQPPVPAESKIENLAQTPDGIDLLITAKNHDLKQAVARNGQAEDWVFALVSGQTGDGYNGQKNYGISRMNGGSSSRPLLGLAPASPDKVMSPRSGTWFRRDVQALLAWRAGDFDMPQFAEDGEGHQLLWQLPWPEGEQLLLSDLDPWYVEICRRVRLCQLGDRLVARKGTSEKARINAGASHGSLGDPWAPVHKTKNISLTLSSRDFDYSLLSRLMFSGDWSLPVLARPAPFEIASHRYLLVAAALSRGNSKTEGYKRRDLPLSGTIAIAMADEQGRLKLADLARQQLDEIALFDRALRHALALYAARGIWDDVGKDHYVLANDACSRLDRVADGLFFPHLWARFEAQDGKSAMATVTTAAADTARSAFGQALWSATTALFDAALPGIPCPVSYRERARTRAARILWGNKKLREEFPALITSSTGKVIADVDA